MQSNKIIKLPLDYKLDKEVFRLIAEANMKYGEYKSLLNNMRFDLHYFLNSMLLLDCYKSTQIEGTQISQDEMYYLKYMENTDENKEIENLKKMIMFAAQQLSKKNVIDYGLFNDVHKILLDSVRGLHKVSGTIRTTQNWIGQEA